LKWGTLLNVKVLKDWANRPFSFVQYTTAQEAGYALQQSQKASLDGRMIRVERARVNRTLYISKEKGKLDEAVPPFCFHSILIALRVGTEFCRLSKHFLNLSDKSRKLLFLDHGNEQAKKHVKAALRDSSFATMPSMHTRSPSPLRNVD